MRGTTAARGSRSPSAALISLAVAAACSGCPTLVPASDQIRFSCVEPDDCVIGQVCFERYCYDRDQLPIADAANPRDGAGVDRLADAAHEAGADAAVDAARDAGLDAASDAAIDAAIDAAVDAAGPDGPASDAPTADVADAAAADAPGHDASVQDGAAGDAGGCRADWWNCDWLERVRLSFDNSQQGRLQNFPVMVRINASRVDYAQLQADGDDVRFVDADNATLLDHEVEKWADNSEGIYWVRVPQIDALSTSDHIWLYYGNPATSSAAHTAGVWDGDFRAVWHLNGNAISSVAGPPTGVFSGGWAAGVAGNGKNFNGSSESVRFNQSPSVLGSLSALTVSAWIKPTALFTSYAGILSTRNGTEADYANGNWVFYLNRDKVGFESASVAWPPGNGERLDTPLAGHLVALTLDPATSRARWYVDGREVYNLSHTIPVYADQDNVVIGARYYSGGLTDWFRGVIDETRVSAVPRTADWLRAEYLAATDAFIQWHRTDWWDTAYGRRLPIRFTHFQQQENLIGFPILVGLTGGSLTWSAVNSDGSDLRFVDADGTELAYETETWHHGSSAAIWVNVPQINAYNSTDHIWLYYGNGSAPPADHGTATWNGDFIGVYHLNGNATNSAAGMRDGITGNLENVAGAVGNGLAFDKIAGDVVVIADSGSLDALTRQLSITVWLQPDQPNANWQAAVSREHGTAAEDVFWLGLHDSQILWRTRLDNLHVDAVSSRLPIAGSWTQLAGLYNGQRLLIAVDGAVDLAAAVDSFGAQPNGNKAVSIGANSNDDGVSWQDNFDGVIDEVRVSRVMRSLAWIEAENRCQTGRLISLGGEQTR